MEILASACPASLGHCEDQERNKIMLRSLAGLQDPRPRRPQPPQPGATPTLYWALGIRSLPAGVPRARRAVQQFLGGPGISTALGVAAVSPKQG